MYTIVPCPDRSTWDKVKRKMFVEADEDGRESLLHCEFDDSFPRSGLVISSYGGTSVVSDYTDYQDWKGALILTPDEYLTPRYTL